MSTISIKEYFAAEGSRFTDKDAKAIGPVLQDLAASGSLTPNDVIEAAKSANCPLNAYFEWDDVKAANLYRVDQATSMIRFIKVRAEVDGKPTEMRAFQVIKAHNDNSNGGGRGAMGPRTRYRNVPILTQESETAAALMDEALVDLQIWRRKYAPYMDMWDKFSACFRGMLNQIQEFEEEISATDVPNSMQNAVAALYKWRDENGPALRIFADYREQAGYIAEAIGEVEKACSEEGFGGREGETSDDAKLLAANPATPKKRKCLSCSREFVSEWAGNRMCPSCSGKSEGIHGF